MQGLPDVLGRWSAGLTPAHVHLLTVPPPGAEPGLLWERFAGILGVDPALAVETVPRTNVSLDAIETAFMRRLNVALKGRSISQPVYADIVRGLLAQQTLSRRFKQIKTELPPESRPFVDEVTAEWREWVQRLRHRRGRRPRRARDAVERRGVGRPRPATDRGP